MLQILIIKLYSVLICSLPLIKCQTTSPKHVRIKPPTAWHVETKSSSDFDQVFSEIQETYHTSNLDQPPEQNVQKQLFSTHLFDNHYVIHLEKNWYSQVSQFPDFNFHNNKLLQQNKKRYLEKLKITENQFHSDLKNNLINQIGNQLKIHPKVKTTNHLYHLPKRSKRSGAFADTNFDDPYFQYQWFLINHNDRRESPKVAIHDLNIIEPWAAGINGKNITICVIDDGVNYRHPDLYQHYNEEGSYDLNAGDDDPFPRYGLAEGKKDVLENTHGTRCAGEIVATPGNKLCGVGVAHGANFTAIRILDGGITDAQEAIAFSRNLHLNDIFSMSWGPDDDGKTVDGPHYLAKLALQAGVNYGRYGLGAIYLVASGNGGQADDNCNFDGYANSEQTITIGVVDSYGNFPRYAEVCASMLASSFSGSNKSRGQYIITTEWDGGAKEDYDFVDEVGDSEELCDYLQNLKEPIVNSNTKNPLDVKSYCNSYPTSRYASLTEKASPICTMRHSGTSAATPLAAGAIALALQANPCLTWRDIQWLIILTSDFSKTNYDQDGFKYHKNAAGLMHSHHYGFGVIDANRLVSASIDWSQKIDFLKENGDLVKPLEFHYNGDLKVPGLEHGLLGQGRRITVRKPKNYPVLPVIFTGNRTFTFDITASDRTEEKSPRKITLLENVQLTVSLEAPRRGNIEILLKCPEKNSEGKVTESRLATKRSADDKNEGFDNWTFSTIRCFGEDPIGTYQVIISNPVRGSSQQPIKVKKLELTITGVEMTREKFNDLQNHAKTATIPENFKQDGVYTARNSLAQCARIDYNLYKNRIDVEIRYRKIQLYLRAAVFLTIIWSLYFLCDCYLFREGKSSENSNESSETKGSQNNNNSNHDNNINNTHQIDAGAIALNENVNGLEFGESSKNRRTLY